MEHTLTQLPVDWSAQPKGYLTATHDELISKLGQPNGNPGDGKVRSLWNILLDDEVYVSIYDWKQYEKKVEDVTEWNIVFKQQDTKKVTNFIKDKNFNIITWKY